MKLYCPLHQRNEHLTAAQTEALIHGLYAYWYDETAEPAGDRDFGQLYAFCPTQLTRSLWDPEMYYEHIEHMRDARLAAARADRQAVSS